MTSAVTSAVTSAKKIVVFDLDGTLIDSAPDIRAAANRMLADQGIAPLELGTIISFIGHGLPRLVEQIIEHVGLDMGHAEMLTDQVLRYYNAAPTELTKLYPGVMTCLTGLKLGGARMGLCTNKPLSATMEILGPMGLGDMFDIVIGGDSLGVKKPDPAPLLECFNVLGGKGLYVGDSEVDAETAARAGVDFALFTQGYRKTPVAELPHSFAFDHFDQLAAHTKAPA